VSLAHDGVLDVDVPAVQITGAVTVNAMALVSQPVDRGAIAFAPPGNTDGLRIDVGTSGRFTYAATLVPGSYDVRFEGNPALCAVPPAPQLPCNAGTIKAAASLTHSGVLDLDVPAVQVTGAVTVRGAAIAAQPVERGALDFASTTTADHVMVSFGTAGAVRYAVTLLPATYDVRFVGNPALCAIPPAPQLPCNAGVVVPGRSLTQTGVLDVDVPVVQVTGAITAGHAPLLDQPTDRGSITFVAAPGADRMPIALGATGKIGYAATLLPGNYDVWFEGNSSLCAIPPAPQLPCNAGAIHPGAMLHSSGVLDLDIPAVQVSGALSVSGTRQLAPAAGRSAARFTMIHGGIGTAGFPGQGPETYAITIVPGSYVVTYAADPFACDPTPTGLAPPCDDQIVRGCP
jgi:hypothetical protein